MDNCDGCKWWSERIARSIGGGPMEAMCLNVHSPCYNRMVCGGCTFYRSGRAIDDPSFVVGDQTGSFSIYEED